VNSEILGPLEATASEINGSKVYTDRMVFFEKSKLIRTTLTGHSFKVDNSVIQDCKLQSKDTAMVKDAMLNNWEAFGLRGALMIARA